MCIGKNLGVGNTVIFNKSCYHKQGDISSYKKYSIKCGKMQFLTNVTYQTHGPFDMDNLNCPSQWQ